MIPALLLAVLTNAMVEVPPSRWQAIDLPIGSHSTVIAGEWAVRQGSTVQVMITDRNQAGRFHRGRSFQPIYSSGFKSEGHFRVRIPEAGNYVLIVDNRIDGRSAAQVSITLEVSSENTVQARELPPERRHAVVALSLLFFGFVVVFSARQFFRNA